MKRPLFRTGVPSKLMNESLKLLAESKYRQPEFLKTLFELAVDGEWFYVQHMVQHDMAKAIIADYSQDIGCDYLDPQLYFENWESVIDVGWDVFCEHTGLNREKVNIYLKKLAETT